MPIFMGASKAAHVHVTNLELPRNQIQQDIVQLYTWSWASILAPALTSSATIDEWPLLAAIISPVLPSCINIISIIILSRMMYNY